MSAKELIFYNLSWFNIPNNATSAIINGVRFLKAPEKLTLNEGVKAYEHPNKALSPVAKATKGDVVQVVGQIDEFYLIMGLVGTGKGFGESKNFNVNPGAVLISEIENGGKKNLPKRFTGKASHYL